MCVCVCVCVCVCALRVQWNKRERERERERKREAKSEAAYLLYTRMPTLHVNRIGKHTLSSQKTAVERYSSVSTELIWDRYTQAHTHVIEYIAF